MNKAIEEIFETYALHKLTFLKLPKASFYNNTRLRYSPPSQILKIALLRELVTVFLYDGVILPNPFLSNTTFNQ